MDLLQKLVAVNNTLAETVCKLKHQAKMPGRASHKVIWVGLAIPKKWQLGITDFFIYMIFAFYRRYL